MAEISIQIYLTLKLEFLTITDGTSTELRRRSNFILNFDNSSVSQWARDLNIFYLFFILKIKMELVDV